MGPLYRQATTRGIWGTLFFITIIFGPAGTFRYWQGWLFLAVFSASTIGFTVYLVLYDKPLLERRLRAGPQYERERSQKIIVSLIYLSFFALIILPALDHRYRWSPVSTAVTILGNVLIVLSFLFIFWVIKVNSYAASNVGVEEDQKVIDRGPYAYVRHPMYVGAFWLMIGVPLALGAWWWTLLVLPFSSVLMWRLLDEERILHRDLPGYTAYTQRVRYRLFPYVW